MTLIADIIVDVPTLQTNRPYTYSIPDIFTDIIQPGMRVVVPFGRGSRKVQGFVIDIKEHETTEMELKAVESLMDSYPVLTKELLKLGEFLAYQTFSFQVKCYQTMLPAVMRAKYSKKVRLIDEIPENLYWEVFKGKDEISWEEAENKNVLSQLIKLEKQDKVEIDYDVKDKAAAKKIKKVKPALSFEAYEEIREGIRTNAKRQKLFIDVLQSMDDKTSLSYAELRELGVTSSTIRSGLEKGWCEVFYEEIYRDPFASRIFEPTTPLTLNKDQAHAFSEIYQTIKDDQHNVFLLKGVTGSGKTEVYLQTIREVIDKGEGALMLVPEIALTPQMVQRFKSRFGDEVAVLHSGLSKGEKYDEWRKIEKEEAKVVVGARSSVFAPLKNIGIIIIDEEHETSYKQEEFPKYHARDVAIWRGNYHNCPVILGSATPSLESRARATKNVYTLLELNNRVNDYPMPDVDVIDMREEAKSGNPSIFSKALLDGLKKRIDQGEQSVLLLNRRGFSSFVMCRDCGYVLECPNCDISQTLHMDTKTMKCHYCGHEEGIPKKCPKCESRSIRYYGTGTQKVEKELKELLDDAEIIRMDVDTTRKKGSHERLFKQFENKQANILLGTQMIAKGLDFPDVTLVGVINADTALGLPDFRSAEKTFQLLTQVSGRSGRGEKEGQVIIQSYNPEHYAIQYAKQHDYDSFYKKEMNLRHLSDYSPYYYLLKITVSHENEMTAAKKIRQYTDYIRPSLSDKAIVLGPTPKSIARTHNRYHFQVLIKYKREKNLTEKIHQLLSETQKEQAKGMYISIDYQPLDFI
ncbi:MAG: primosomal protein N' [Alkalibacterium gilvum]|uniref:Replication restart protein PriA n=1 Tax=Alkalibacterium gilvum TaxID=1130080 RepID=A0A1H6R031_9LACT|nr:MULTISPECIES: primosomal protein N' [Alkalibacterium]MDN6293073.1 primosomal protein N' [Alkalibacterium sp.]MDN6294879.1 primosomal protein N' [Alkalibacterium sp.]MDN6397417.1 primosomal protein N' [Alkalibacterium sp.]MDN6728873.1 primosomal protein N' [Alkalibacterium sp.]SEI47706.1 replication restart DNA helicase PriA [Alkalibacterium gilvum]